MRSTNAVHIFPYKALLLKVLEGSTRAVRVNTDPQNTHYLHIVGALMIGQSCRASIETFWASGLLHGVENTFSSFLENPRFKFQISVSKQKNVFKLFPNIHIRT